MKICNESNISNIEKLLNHINNIKINEFSKLFGVSILGDQISVGNTLYYLDINDNKAKQEFIDDGSNSIKLIWTLKDYRILKDLSNLYKMSSITKWSDITHNDLLDFRKNIIWAYENSVLKELNSIFSKLGINLEKLIQIYDYITVLNMNGKSSDLDINSILTNNICLYKQNLDILEMKSNNKKYIDEVLNKLESVKIQLFNLNKNNIVISIAEEQSIPTSSTLITNSTIESNVTPLNKKKSYLSF